MYMEETLERDGCEGYQSSAGGRGEQRRLQLMHLAYRARVRWTCPCARNAEREAIVRTLSGARRVRLRWQLGGRGGRGHSRRRVCTERVG